MHSPIRSSRLSASLLAALAISALLVAVASAAEPALTKTVVVTEQPNFPKAPVLGTVVKPTPGAALDKLRGEPGTPIDGKFFMGNWASCPDPNNYGDCPVSGNMSQVYTPSIEDAGNVLVLTVLWFGEYDSSLPEYDSGAAGVAVSDRVKVPASVGSAKASAKLKLKKLLVGCRTATKTGNCTGTVKLTGQGKKGKKVKVSNSLKVPVGTNAEPLVLKLSKSQIKSMKKAKGAKASISITYKIPGTRTVKVKTSVKLAG